MESRRLEPPAPGSCRSREVLGEEVPEAVLDGPVAAELQELLGAELELVGDRELEAGERDERSVEGLRIAKLADGVESADRDGDARDLERVGGLDADLVEGRGVVAPDELRVDTGAEREDVAADEERDRADLAVDVAAVERAARAHWFVPAMSCRRANAETQWP